jgi:putative oxidoreductase
MGGLILMPGPRVSLALLLLRIVTGASFILHGLPKLAHPAGWLNGPTAPLHGVPAWLQLVVCLAETLGGLCILIGFLTPLFAFLQACDMLVAGFYVKAGLRGMPYVGSGPGPTFELESHLFVSALILLLCGPGLYSVDAAIKMMRERGTPRSARRAA